MNALSILIVSTSLLYTQAPADNPNEAFCQEWADKIEAQAQRGKDLKIALEDMERALQHMTIPQEKAATIRILRGVYQNKREEIKGAIEDCIRYMEE